MNSCTKSFTPFSLPATFSQTVLIFLRFYLLYSFFVCLEARSHVQEVNVKYARKRNYFMNSFHNKNFFLLGHLLKLYKEFSSFFKQQSHFNISIVLYQVFANCNLIFQFERHSTVSTRTSTIFLQN